jgi:Killing trait
MREDVDYIVTDSVAQTNTIVVGAAPAMGTATQYQTQANSIFMASLNAVFAQHQANMAYQAATVQEVIQLLSKKEP